VLNRVEAKISNIGNLDPTGDEIFAARAIQVTASDSSTINSMAGALAISGVGSTGASGAIGASVAANYLGADPRDKNSTKTNVVRAAIENVTGTVKAGSIDVHATYDGRITNVTVAGAGATGQGAAFALGGSVSVNRIRNTSEAVISNAAGVTTTGATETSLQVRADDTSKIWAMAGGVGVAIPQGGGAAVAAGVAVAKNEITSRTTASTVNSKITSGGGIAITADSVPTIFALSIGIGVAAGSGFGAALGAAGAGSNNLIDCTTEAFISGSLARDVVASGGGVVISATDKSKILGVAGSLALAGQFGGGGVAASVGVSVVDNTITPHTHAYVDSSKVSASSGLTLHSSHVDTI